MWLKLIEGEFQHRGGFVIIWSEYDNLIALSCLVISCGLIESSTSSLREKCPSTELFLVRIFPHSDWIRRNTKYLSVFSLNAGKYRPKQLRIRTLLMQCQFISLTRFMLMLLFYTPLKNKKSLMNWSDKHWPEMV